MARFGVRIDAEVEAAFAPAADGGYLYERIGHALRAEFTSVVRGLIYGEVKSLTIDYGEIPEPVELPTTPGSVVKETYGDDSVAVFHLNYDGQWLYTGGGPQRSGRFPWGDVTVLHDAGKASQ